MTSVTSLSKLSQEDKAKGHVSDADTCNPRPREPACADGNADTASHQQGRESLLNGQLTAVVKVGSRFSVLPTEAVQELTL